MSEKKFGKRFLTWALTMVLTVSLLPLSAMAEELEEKDAPLMEAEMEVPAEPAEEEDETAAEPAEEEEDLAAPAEEESEDADFEETAEAWDAYVAGDDVPVAYGTSRKISLTAAEMKNCTIAYVEGASLTGSSALKTQSSTGTINDISSINGKYGIMIFAKPNEGYALSYMGAVTGSNFYSIADGGVDSDGNADVGSSQFFREYDTGNNGNRLEANDVVDGVNTAKTIVAKALAAGYHGTMFYSRPENGGTDINDTIYFAAEKLPEFKKEIVAVKHRDASDFVPFTDGMTIGEGDTIRYQFTVTFAPAAYSFVKDGRTQYASVSYSNITINDPMIGYSATLDNYTSGAEGAVVTRTADYVVKEADLVDGSGNDKASLINLATLHYNYQATYSRGTVTKTGMAAASIPVRRAVSYRYVSVDSTPLPKDFPAAPNGILKQAEGEVVTAAAWNMPAEYRTATGKWVRVSENWEDEANDITVAPGGTFTMIGEAVTLTARWQFIKDVTVTGSIDHGTVNGTNNRASQTISAGEDSAAMAFVPEEGYEITQVTVNGEEENFTLNDNGSYTYGAQSGVQDDISVVVTTQEKSDNTDSGETPVDPENPDNNGGDNGGDNPGNGGNTDNGDNSGNSGSTDNGDNSGNSGNTDNGSSETPPTPSRPSRPSRPSSSTDNTVTIEDDDALGLNTTDHFAYIVGYGNGEVRPQNNITRAEVATIFFRLLTDDVRDANLTKSNPYPDVAATSWYNTAVSTLSSMGIITGYPDGTFRPNAAITRAEFAAIAARFDNDGDKTTAKFSDIANHWAKDEISIAYNNGWINGYPDGTFGPQRDITRAETMTLVNRVLNRLPETEEDLLPDMVTWTDNANPNAWYYLAVQEATNSHYYKFKTNSQYEKWTELRETRDWTLLEK